jgi:hypothetical protein
MTTPNFLFFQIPCRRHLLQICLSWDQLKKKGHGFFADFDVKFLLYVYIYYNLFGSNFS